MSLPNEFFTVNSFLTLAGAYGIVLTVTAALNFLFDGKIAPKWIAVILSEMISFIGAFALTDPPDNVALAIRILIALFNGFLIFATAFGLNAITTKPESAPAPGQRRAYWSRW